MKEEQRCTNEIASARTQKDQHELLVDSEEEQQGWDEER